MKSIPVFFQKTHTGMTRLQLNPKDNENKPARLLEHATSIESNHKNQSMPFQTA
jgi:hypothetical protein